LHFLPAVSDFHHRADVQRADIPDRLAYLGQNGRRVCQATVRVGDPFSPAQEKATAETRPPPAG